MKGLKLTRRSVVGALAIGVSALALLAGTGTGFAGDTIKIGVSLPLTGADAEDAKLIQNGFMMAIDEVNEKGGIGGKKIEPIIKDSGTATAGQYDPAQAATNTKALIADPEVVVNLGPEMSGEGKAMTPILSEADMATITPTSTNPDITDPTKAAQFRPKGKAIYFRTVTTDAYQGPNMANFFKQTLKVSNVYVLDDAGAYGVGIADSFQKQAEKIGLKILGRDQLDPKAADYATILTKIKGLNPESIYFGGVAQAGVKLAKQAHDILGPEVKKGGGDGIQGGSFLKGVGFPAADGWYCTNAGPHVVEDPAMKEFIDKFKTKYGSNPNDYSVTSYDAAMVAIDAIKRVLDSGKELNRSNVRDAVHATKLKTLQGEVSFDENGDINDRTVSVFQYQHNKDFPDDDVIHQLKYFGVAPQS